MNYLPSAVIVLVTILVAGLFHYGVLQPLPQEDWADVESLGWVLLPWAMVYALVALAKALFAFRDMNQPSDAALARYEAETARLVAEAGKLDAEMWAVRHASKLARGVKS